MLKTVFVTVAACASVLAAGAAQAGTHWSVGISVPVPGVYVSEAPRYVAPPPVYYAPPPVVYSPRYVEREVVYVPAPQVVYEPRPYHNHWRDRDDDRRWHETREWRERWDREPIRAEGPYREAYPYRGR